MIYSILCLVAGQHINAETDSGLPETSAGEHGSFAEELAGDEGTMWCDRNLTKLTEWAFNNALLSDDERESQGQKLRYLWTSARSCPTHLESKCDPCIPGEMTPQDYHKFGDEDHFGLWCEPGNGDTFRQRCFRGVRRDYLPVCNPTDAAQYLCKDYDGTREMCTGGWYIDFEAHTVPDTTCDEACQVLKFLFGHLVCSQAVLSYSGILPEIDEPLPEYEGTYGGNLTTEEVPDLEAS